MRAGVKCEKWEEFVTMWASVVCTFRKAIKEVIKKYLRGNEQKH